MKVPFPLSLKISLWLLLNLLLLAAVAILFLVAQAGLSWDSLVASKAGDRLHTLAAAIAGEVVAADPAERSSVLDRFGAEFGAEFMLVSPRGSMIGAAGRVPEPVARRLQDGPPRGRGAMGGRFDGDDEQRAPNRTSAEVRRGGRGRFLIRTAEPTEWWIGFRVPFPDFRGPLEPATLLIRAESAWAVLRLLDLGTWLLAAASVLGLSILFWLPLVRSISREVRILTLATEQIADGNFRIRVPSDRNDELGRLAESVNTMAGRLDSLVNGQKRFLADIAHELGSPVGRLQVATEILETKAPPDLREHVNDVREEVQQMSSLLGELLDFTKAGLRAKDATLAIVPLDRVVSTVLAREDPAGRVQKHFIPSLRVAADEALLSRAIANLVRNALRYAADSQSIAICAKSEAGRVAIAVEDEGPGVPAAELERLGEPFYRPELARSRDTGGAGLGLAIVRSAIAACGGTVSFANRVPHGFRAEIRLAEA